MDIENRTYDEIIHYSVPSYGDCRGKCLDVNTTDLAGMSYQQLPYEKCTCLFADDQIPSQPGGSTYAVYSNNGIGSIGGTRTCDSIDAYRCYSLSGYEYYEEGVGCCTNSSGVQYDFISFIGVHSLPYCKHLCDSNSTGYVGLEYNNENLQCNCLYTDGNAPSQPPTDASYSSFHGYARGAISHSDGSENEECYSYNGFVAKVSFM